MLTSFSIFGGGEITNIIPGNIALDPNFIDFFSISEFTVTGTAVNPNPNPAPNHLEGSNRRGVPMRRFFTGRQGTATLSGRA